MGYREVPQPDGDCCLGGYCWRKYCPDRNNMRRYIVAEAIRRDCARADGGDHGHTDVPCDVASDIPELSDEDRE
mgnify:CR=1 FL=1